ncbi:MAG: PQQ-dependent sugar dehydrogenase [Halomonas sp.]|nr:PQQ-dependent sugar dehydrogenase [Halomonas sp.]MCC5882537.1 PQQ-dependent sugar dehydrogenase [Halomonas sp.]
MHEAYKQLSVVLLAGVAASAPAQAVEEGEERIATEGQELRLERVAQGLEHPWSVAMLPDGRFLVSERPGRMAMVDEGGSISHLEGVPQVSAQGQGGLLDVSLHPRYGDGDHDWVYFTWSKPGDGGSATALSRARLTDNALTDVETLFEQDRTSSPGRHYGSRIGWLPDETLLISIGDRGTPERAQDQGDHAGSVLRLTSEGGVPDDNPFLGDDATLDELFTLGNRNVQGMVVTDQGVVWATEHGPLGGDELNFIEAGENYGWPAVSQGRDYGTREPIGEDSLSGMRDPVHVFDVHFAPSGLTQITSTSFGDWQGDLLAGGLRSEQLHRLSVDGREVVASETVLDGHIGRIRDVIQGQDGAIYLINDEAQGSLYRLRPVD